MAYLSILPLGKPPIMLIFIEFSLLTSIMNRDIIYFERKLNYSAPVTDGLAEYRMGVGVVFPGFSGFTGALMISLHRLNGTAAIFYLTVAFLSTVWAALFYGTELPFLIFTGYKITMS